MLKYNHNCRNNKNNDIISDSKYILECKNIFKYYDKNVLLHDINLSIRAGEMVALLGASGVGKTTLLNIIGLLLQQDSGDVYYDGEKCSDSNRDKEKLRKEKFSYIYQQPYLISDLDVVTNVLLPCKIASFDKSQYLDILDELLDILGILHLKYKSVNKLSGGEKQRVSIARAFIKKPKIIFADEPTGNLDEDNAKNILLLMHDFLRRFGSAFFVVTHSNLLADKADRVFFLKDKTLSC